MLKGLSIQNFALIDNLKVSFDTGLITITGETGAGKSLLLGALGLLLGKRADPSSVKDSSKKCIIEGSFDVQYYELQSFFEDEDLDYESQTIIRREILPSGKSRAFINDTPVTLQSLSALGDKLIDIHSQHQTLQVASTEFQFEVLDALSATEREIQSYKRGLSLLKRKEKELATLQHNKEQFKKEYDYNFHLLQELQEAKLKEGELEELEETFEQLNNVEEIQEKLSEALAVITAEQLGALEQLNISKLNLAKISGFSSTISALSERMHSVYIELDDISTSLQNELENVEADPELLQKTEDRLNLLNNLLAKHSAATIAELIPIREELQDKVAKTESVSEDIEQLVNEVNEIKSQLDALSLKIHEKRKTALPKLTKELEEILGSLGMVNATFKADLYLKEQYLSNGKDELEFLFSANKGTAYGPLKKVASGGELSRIMLGIKAILSDYAKLPTLIFDEIDTGVSGEIAQKMADLMKRMSKNLQVVSITHLPQIAANGESHFKVYKEDVDNQTTTRLRLLNNEERIREIAEMIDGKNVSDSALVHARSLLHI
ncbi:DNA repair protein RecN [Aquimarina brevivitae]|uniref:DNA repair protein RecN n=1 Tax=Aquimarina brevivitae TaxID=323412 RepID=A0A4Q7NZ52_9FLAO|nr:DNA repair protein RecN [Aquimarina brevivitae]RZS92604.1 DNA replication and repair protein RecN [Aquimarina brevivitae]